MVKDGEDYQGLQKRNLKNEGFSQRFSNCDVASLMTHCCKKQPATEDTLYIFIKCGSAVFFIILITVFI